MDEWKQVAVYFYAATVAMAILIILIFFSYKLYTCGKTDVPAEYGNVCVSDDEQDIKLEMPKYSDEPSDGESTNEEEETKNREEETKSGEEEIFVIADSDE